MWVLRTKGEFGTLEIAWVQQRKQGLRIGEDLHEGLRASRIMFGEMNLLTAAAMHWVKSSGVWID